MGVLGEARTRDVTSLHAMAPTKEIAVRVNHYDSVKAQDGDLYLSVSVAADGSDSVADLKQKISDPLYNALSADEIKVMFGPCDVYIGKEFQGDPYVDEKAVLLKHYSFLSWIERFPDWYLTVRALGPTPPPPGVAEVMAASTVKEEGKLPLLQDLPKPWGSKPVEKVPRSKLVSLKKMPAEYPASSQPSVIAGA